MAKHKFEVPDSLWENFAFHAVRKFGAEFEPTQSASVDAIKLWLTFERGTELIELILSGV